MYRIVYPCYDVDQDLMCIVYPCYDVGQDLICIVSYIHVMMSIRIQCVKYHISML